MHKSNHRLVPDDLKPICDELLNSSVLDLYDHDNYVNVFKDYFYDGCTLELTAEKRDYSVRQIERVAPAVLFRVFIIALATIKHLKSNF